MAKDPEALLVSSLQAAAQNWSVFDWDGKFEQWETIATQSKDNRELSMSARKQLAENTKQFKKSVKTVETAGTNLNSANTEENASATVKAIEALAKNCRITVKAYQGKNILACGAWIQINGRSFFVSWFLPFLLLFTRRGNR
jgi:hypothetical protein